MEQLALYFEGEQYQQLKTVVRDSAKAIKRKYPRPVKDETEEEYRMFLFDETLLEIAARLQKIALTKQKNDIDFLYGGKDGNY